MPPAPEAKKERVPQDKKGNQHNIAADFVCIVYRPAEATGRTEVKQLKKRKHNEDENNNHNPFGRPIVAFLQREAKGCALRFICTGGVHRIMD